MNGWFADGTEPKRGELTIAPPVDLSSADAVWAFLDAQDGDGWLCTTDRAVRWPASQRPGGSPLAAELALKDGRSLHLRQHGAIWRAWLLSDRLGDGPHLAVDEAFLSTERPARLTYRSWWRLEPGDDEVEVWRPFAARLLGWENG